MKKNKLFLIILIIFLFNIKDTYAFTSEDYKYRNLCANYEVAGFHTDGQIDTVSCHNTFGEARTFMKNNGADDLAIMTKVNGLTKIIDANVGLLDLSVNPETLTYFYTNSELTSSSYTYMDTGSLYGGVDGAHIDSSYSNSKNMWTAKVKIGNFTGWIGQSTYEIVPITWVKSTSTYTITTDAIRHNYVAKIQNTYSGSAGSTIGPKPSMLGEGTYYSYDGKYFYKDLKNLIKDYKNGNYNNSVNKNNPYYNYYMYLSNHTKTTYSSINIDEYIRNSLNIKEDAYGNASNNGSSRLYGKGNFFYYAQEKYGVNAILSLSLSRNETGNGRSNLAINKNNGFGLNAVDSSPTESADWYASFASSILGYASKWITYGYAHPRDWRYFGPQFGDKWIGMNVKYASDTYWSEKMAANYYSLDRAKGLQDYNYYQLGVVTRQVNAMSDATNSSRFIYSYPEAEDGLVIVGEKQGENVNGNSTWYKVVSDLNIDSNYNEIASGNYNWNGYVYVPAAYVKKINTGKNGYISPNSVTQYQNKDYEYDLFVEETVLKPRVGLTIKDTDYYYDSSLQSKKNQRLLNNRYVMVYAATYDKNKNIVSYLVTSNYKYDQKEWIPASALKLVASDYGKVSVTVSGNQYTWVNSIPEDTKQTLISGQYTNSYVPVLEQKTVGSDLWYKVPVDLSGTTNEFGWTLARAPGVNIELFKSIVKNNPPVIIAKDKTIVQGTEFKEKENIAATDIEDGNLTEKIVVIKNDVKIHEVGTYEVIYKVTDSKNETTTKTIKVTVTENKKPTISAEDIEIVQGKTFEEKKNVTAKDDEDGDLTEKIVVKENTTKNDIPGTYKIVYEVTDSYNQTTTKEIKVVVLKDEAPVINTEDKVIAQKTTFDEKNNVTATDKEDGDLTEKIEVIKNTVNTKELGEYIVIYEVTDSFGNSVQKEIKVTVVEKVLEEKAGEFDLNQLTWDTTKKIYTISGYLIILNEDNSADNTSYELILKNKLTGEKYSLEVNPWTKDVPYNLGSENGKSYTNSWFKGTIDMSKIPAGDYDLYMKAVKNNFYTEQLVNNIFNKKIDRRAETTEQGYNFKVLLSLKSKKIELSIREGNLITTSTANTFRNMVNDYDNMKFVDNKLQVIGTSYNYDGTYSNSEKITRKLILENTNTYKQYSYDIGSTKDGSYKVISSDNKDKSFAWYNAKIDIDNLPKGTYSMLVYTKTTDSEDYGEIVDIFAAINKAEATINNKKYRITLNKTRQNRLELVVE